MKNIKRKNINFIYDIRNMRVEGEQRYFTAEEAKRVSNEVSKEQMNAELDEVYNKINEARFKGKSSVVIGKFFISISTTPSAVGIALKIASSSKRK